MDIALPFGPVAAEAARLKRRNCSSGVNKSFSDDGTNSSISPSSNGSASAFVASATIVTFRDNTGRDPTLKVWLALSDADTPLLLLDSRVGMFLSIPKKRLWDGAWPGTLKAELPVSGCVA